MHSFCVQVLVLITVQIFNNAAMAEEPTKIDVTPFVKSAVKSSADGKDSIIGNLEKVAQDIASSLKEHFHVEVDVVGLFKAVYNAVIEWINQPGKIKKIN